MMYLFGANEPYRGRFMMATKRVTVTTLLIFAPYRDTLAQRLFHHLHTREKLNDGRMKMRPSRISTNSPCRFQLYVRASCTC